MERFLNKLLESLNSVEVHGKNNMDILLGCILETEKMLVGIRARKSEKEAEVDSAGESDAAAEDEEPEWLVEETEEDDG